MFKFNSFPSSYFFEPDKTFVLRIFFILLSTLKMHLN